MVRGGEGLVGRGCGEGLVRRGGACGERRGGASGEGRGGLVMRGGE